MALTLQSAKQDLRTRPFIFVAYSAYTNLPYVTCDEETFNDQVWFFFREEDIKEFGKKKAEDKILLRAVKFERKNYLQLYSLLYSIGVNSVVWNKSGQKLEIEIGELARQADLSKLEESKRPLVNPTLQLSGIYFMQELRRPVSQEEHGDVRSLEEEVLANLVKSEYLVPFIPDIEDPKKMMIPFVKTKDGKNFRPVCSDVFEMQKFAGKVKMALAKIPFEGLLKSLPDQADGVIINPAGFNMALPKENLSRLAEAMQADDGEDDEEE